MGRVRNDSNGYILVGGKDKDGYRQVTLQSENKQYCRRVCRLVALAFIPNPDNLPCVNHIDENILNDRYDNLEWCTVKYNNNYGTRILKASKPVMCIETGEMFISTRCAERKTGIKHTNIGSAAKNNRTAGGFHWKYIDKESYK